MATVNNINILKIASVSGAASVNMGNTINLGTESNTKSVGGSSVIGDYGRNSDSGGAIYNDQDLIDQSNVV
ncbi:spore germination protein [Marininema halotolerans]|uniref:Spore germination protein gerPA/gerPF n=1 Tax=Marininema halotolerans TaxID=1155944 RepID=A0A1I6UF79_9BACL|nr:spore germination protein [Marininema halotolerans]SFT00075.1 Spore germination protein gerPA/gerPF [Marininema halotolerans]